ncbi:hypothetical protein [Kitasatospora sp. MBT63]|uniref:hypothetical protein n=1 Tax=Kitasatospora sp. MBT63 TaxID=1444768 RepID=UPI00053AAD9E|nr:hypothetical protein [Kitasatospora sp. MBT63]
MSTPINLPGLGVIRPTNKTDYRADQPLSVEAVRDLIRQKWVHSVQVSDGQGGAAEFHATCELNGKAFTVTGQIGGR